MDSDKAAEKPFSAKEMTEFYEEFTKQVNILTEKVKELPEGKRQSFVNEIRHHLGGSNSWTAQLAPFVPWLSVFLGVIVLVLAVFFGYKLYKSLTEKERKRDEKRKQKQLKKRK